MATSVSELEDRIASVFSIKTMTENQKKAVLSILNSNDVFVTTRTGSGKSLCYQALCIANPNKTALVVSPLISIMQEQVAELRRVSLSATYIGKSLEDDKLIEEGKFQLVYGSAESMVGNEKWRNVWQSPLYQNRIVALVVDEAHTVSLWGERQEDDEPFREWYGKIRELRSLSDVPLMALTATCSPTSRHKVMEKLCMLPANTVMIVDSPDRPNIKLSVTNINSNEETLVTFSWLISELGSQRHSAERHVIFCKSIVDCARVNCAFLHVFGRDCPLFAMYHSKTPQYVKNNIKEDMSNEKGTIRVLICTNAAGMGVNFKGLHYVVHYGPPQDLDTFIQQIGRAGRDGVQSHQILIFNNRQLRNVDIDILCYVRNSNECRRKVLLESYKCHTNSEVKWKHLCCDICEQSCKFCDETCPYVHPYKLAKHLDSGNSDDREGECSGETVDYREKELLRAALEAYQMSLVSRATDKLLIDVHLIHGFTENLIQEIIAKSLFLFTADDVMLHTKIWSYSHAKSVISIINKIFDRHDSFYEPEQNFETESDDSCPSHLE